MYTPLELRVLTSFLVLADELNFTRAARRLNMTQPPLSLQIKQLEAQIGAQLFERNKRSVRLTPAGQVLRAEAEKLFDIEHRARQMVTQADRGENVGHLGIGLTAISAIELVPDILRQFSAHVPGVLYSLRETSSEAMIQSLLGNELDVAILRPPVTDSRLQARRLMSEPYVLAAPGNHPLAGKSSVNARDLDGQSLATLERRHGQYAHDLMMTWLAEHNVVPSCMHDGARHHAMMAMVAAGVAVSLVPASAAAQPVKGVVYRRIANRDVPTLELWIAFHKEIGNPLTLPFVEQAVEIAAGYTVDQRCFSGQT
ncbi:DNA-binding transcriptional regulator, LysR family [Cupriavidus sp. OV038]|jgi:DNA-binding transcriptional LysR family regulator|uniref:LysR family transcriptional regulator n=1 Tax=unclassified Cupriavidus TaxID=2640874 RepID=UPI0008EE10AE|nr:MULTISPECIES: LysR substrate-binding domain-containing protein [unclassified Cupriavidus]SFC60369.1 DNA-binding transcriptional regulator, LysR family [Cupriavidus sp. OV038]SFP42617.1 DNA-binding transcriptional regulator, LysR family [Cupriavidus sp. OV096]